MLVSGPMAYLVQKDGQEVHLAGGGGAWRRAEAVGAEDERELRGVAGRGVDEPTMAGGVEVEGDGGAVRLAKDAIGEVGDQEGRGAGGKGEALGGESVGPDRKGEVGEALKVCVGEGGGGGGGRGGGGGEKIVRGGGGQGGKHGERAATRP